MYYSVVEFGKLGLVPTVGGAYQITGDTLQLVDMGTTAFGDKLQGWRLSFHIHSRQRLRL